MHVGSEPTGLPGAAATPTVDFLGATVTRTSTGEHPGCECPRLHTAGTQARSTVVMSPLLNVPVCQMGAVLSAVQCYVAGARLARGTRSPDNAAGPRHSECLGRSWPDPWGTAYLPGVLGAHGTSPAGSHLRARAGGFAT